MDKTANFVVLVPWIVVRIENNFNGFSLIDVNQNATLSNSFEGDRSRVIGNRCNYQTGKYSSYCQKKQQINYNYQPKIAEKCINLVTLHGSQENSNYLTTFDRFYSVPSGRMFFFFFFFLVFFFLVFFVLFFHKAFYFKPVLFLIFLLVSLKINKHSFVAQSKVQPLI